ncbi:MAG: PQQ-binding-like beta-propeller repeat protein, partial [Pirellulales bacterium]
FMLIRRERSLIIGHAAAVVIGLCASLPNRAVTAQERGDGARTWTDETGEYRIVATMIKYDEGNVHLEKADGQIIVIPLSKLSPSDQRWVRKKLARLRANKKREPADEPRATETAPTTAEWPGWRGPNRDGKSADTGLLKQWPPEGPELAWSVNDIGKGFSSVAVANDTVYITGDTNNRLMLFALDLNGRPQWKVEIDAAWTKSSPGARSTPTIDGNNLYLVSGNGVVGCYDAGDGRSKWKHHMREFGGGTPHWGYSESVLLYQNLAVITPGGSNCIVALDKSSGHPVWNSQGVKAGAQYSSCYAFTHDGVPMIVNGTAEGIVCVDPRNGRMLWANPFSARNTANCPTPVYGDGYVFWANGYGKGGICLKLVSTDGGVAAQQAWTTRDMVCHHGGYIIHDGHIYGNNGNGWACLELATGKQLWQERGVGKGSLCYADGMLYLFGERGGKVGLATCTPEGLEMRGSFSVQGDGPSWAHPVVIGGRLFIRYDTNLYCYNVREGG